MNDSPGTLHVPGRVGALDPTRGAWGELLLSTPLVGGPGDAENKEQLGKSLLHSLTTSHILCTPVLPLAYVWTIIHTKYIQEVANHEWECMNK